MLMMASVSVSVSKNSSDVLLMTVQETCSATASQGFYQNNICLTEVWTMWDCVVAGHLFGYCLLCAHFSGNIAWGSGKHFKNLECSLT